MATWFRNMAGGLVISISTHAFGSQRCRSYSGMFTMNAIMQTSHRKILDQESDTVWTQSWVNREFNELTAFWIEIRVIGSGREPNSVQNTEVNTCIY